MSTTDDAVFDEEPLPTEMVPVMRQHLFEGLTALDAALTISTCQDIIEKNKNLKSTIDPSPLTKRLGKAYDLLIQYIGVENEQQQSDTDGVVHEH